MFLSPILSTSDFFAQFHHPKCLLGQDFSKNRKWRLFNDFYCLLDRHHTKHHDVGFYADKLHITPDYLYKLIHGIENVSPKEIIDRYITVAIKTLLQSTDLFIKNIATELHFDDPPYMCRFFRRMTGMSPLEYRDNVKVEYKKRSTAIETSTAMLHSK